VGSWDPVAQRLFPDGWAPQFCYVDDIGSWVTNEITITWNSALSWVASFVADQDEALVPANPTCAVSYTIHGEWPGGFNAQGWITNTEATPINGWELVWDFIGDQSIAYNWSAVMTQDGSTVTATNLTWNSKIYPGASVTFGFIGDPGELANADPEMFRLNGAACTVEPAGQQGWHRMKRRAPRFPKWARRYFPWWRSGPFFRG